MNILEQIINEFKSITSVKAIVLGGSRASGYNDEISDYDLYIYITEPINIQKRHQIAQKFADSFEIDNNFFENGDEWILKTSGNGIDIMYRSPKWLEEQVLHTWENHEASLGYSTCIIYNIKNSIILYDSNNWYTNIQEKVNGNYPDELAQNIICKNLPLIYGKMSASFTDQILLAVKRKDINSINHRISAFLASYFDVIFALNKELHPGEKRLIKFAENNCKILPANFEENITNLINCSMKEKECYLNKIINELKQVVN